MFTEMPPSLSLASQVVLACLCLYGLWRRFIAKSPLSAIPGPPRTSWLKGCRDQVYDPNGWKFHHDILEKYGSVVKLPMMFGKEELYVTDPLALHHIFIKDQYIYEETSMFLAVQKLVIGDSLLSTLGERHRKQRKMLNPVFSIKHMRDLLSVFYPIAYDLRDILIEKARNGPNEIDVMHWLSRVALDFIGQAGFGYAFNALHDEKASEYGEYFKKIVPLTSKLSSYRHFLPELMKIGPPAFRRKVLECIPVAAIKEHIDAVDVLDTQSRVIYQEKKRALENGDDVTWRKVGMGKDILSVLLKANMAADEADRLPEEEVIGQINTFVVAGQDTTSHALARTLHQLSLNLDVQARMRDEIVSALKDREGADFDYDTLMGLPYLDAVCRETLRLFPPVSALARTTRKDVVMPLAWPVLGADGKSEVTEIAIKKNTNVIVSIIGANRSKKIWGEDAEEWKPERWLNPLPESVSKAHLPGVYSSMMTFIGGGRACIGFKFAEMEMKLVLAMLLELFEFKPGPEAEWRMTGVSAPMLKHSADKTSRLPLEVLLLKDVKQME